MRQIEAGTARGFDGAEYPLQELSGQIIGAYYAVYNALGYGFLESVYRRAMAVELSYRGLRVVKEVGYRITHRGVHVGLYRADLVVESSVIVEVKAGRTPDPMSGTQTLNYLRASGLRLGLILHFGPQPLVKRILNPQQRNADRSDRAD